MGTTPLDLVTDLLLERKKAEEVIANIDRTLEEVRGALPAAKRTRKRKTPANPVDSPKAKTPKEPGASR